MLPLQIISDFSVSVRSLRHRLGMSQEELAERAHLHQTYIAGIEVGGRNPTLKTVEKLARALQVSVPALLLHDSGTENPGKTACCQSAAGQYVDILMVEDSLDDVELTVEAFNRARMTNSVQVVRDGKEALDYLFCSGDFAHRKMADQPHLVLLDLNLPRIGGMDVLRRIKGDDRTRLIPVVVLTASRDSRELALCRRLGAETFIVKPVDFQGLSQATPVLNLHWALLKPPEARADEPRGTFSV